MEVLLIWLQSALMAFGAPAVDDISPAGFWPTRSFLTGFLGAALGLRRDKYVQLSRLQDRIRYAVRCDREPKRLVDLQTALVAKEGMREPFLTPYGWVASRDAQWLTGNAVMRRREYLIDGAFLVALTLDTAEESPTVHDLHHKLQFPEAVLSIGRRPCIPSARVARGVVQAPSLLDALRTVPPPTKAPLRAFWPKSEGVNGRVVEVIEDKDWANGIHTGRRRMYEGHLSFPAEAS